MRCPLPTWCAARCVVLSRHRSRLAHALPPKISKLFPPSSSAIPQASSAHGPRLRLRLRLPPTQPPGSLAPHPAVARSSGTGSAEPASATVLSGSGRDSSYVQASLASWLCSAHPAALPSTQRAAHQKSLLWRWRVRSRTKRSTVSGGGRRPAELPTAATQRATSSGSSCSTEPAPSRGCAAEASASDCCARHSPTSRSRGGTADSSCLCTASRSSRGIETNRSSGSSSPPQGRSAPHTVPERCGVADTGRFRTEGSADGEQLLCVVRRHRALVDGHILPLHDATHLPDE